MNDPLDGAVAPWLWLVCQGVSRARRPAWLSLHMRLPHVMVSLACWEWDGVSNYGFTESRKPVGCSAGRRCSTTLVT